MKITKSQLKQIIKEEVSSTQLQEGFGITGKGIGFDIKALLTSPGKLDELEESVRTLFRRVRDLFDHYGHHKPHGDISDEEYAEIVDQAEIDLNWVKQMLSAAEEEKGFMSKPHRLRKLLAAQEKINKTLKSLSKFDSKAQALLKRSADDRHLQRLQKELDAELARLKKEKPLHWDDYEPSEDPRFADLFPESTSRKDLERIIKEELEKALKE